MTLNALLLDLSRILLQFIIDILYFPVWWYTRGFFNVLKWSKKFLGTRLRASGLWIWLSNIFTPMYGQSDWAGLLISFITRFLQVVVRSIWMLLWLIYTITLVLIWLALPVYIIYQILFQLHV